jgi:L,D-transpeptidase ErfK/SrfK
MKPVNRCSVLLLCLCSNALAATYELPLDGSDVVGEITRVTTTFDDTLVDLAREHGIGYQDIVRANPNVNVWVPGEGTEVLIPSRYVLPAGPRTGVVLNLAEYRLYYYPEPQTDEPALVMTFPISIGRMDWETPLGRTTVVSKVTNPSWYPPQSVRDEHAAEGRPLESIVPPGPDNPLGKHAMRLGLPGYLIHGTNRPSGVGMRVTHGCLRMFPEDIRYLFDYVAVKTPVRIINEPVKIGWQGDVLVMESHPVLESAPRQETDEPSPDDVPVETHEIANEKNPLTYVTEQYIVATADRAAKLDWSLAEDAVQRSDGMPLTVGTGIKNAATSAASE